MGGSTHGIEAWQDHEDKEKREERREERGERREKREDRRQSHRSRQRFRNKAARRKPTLFYPMPPGVGTSGGLMSRPRAEGRDQRKDACVGSITSSMCTRVSATGRMCTISGERVQAPPMGTRVWSDWSAEKSEE